jgi:hypothetical protein
MIISRELKITFFEVKTVNINGMSCDEAKMYESRMSYSKLSYFATYSLSFITPFK